MKGIALPSFLFSVGLVSAGFALAVDNDFESGANYLRPLDLVISADRLFVLSRRGFFDQATTGPSEEVREVLLDTRSRTAGKELFKLELTPEIFGSYESFGSVPRAKAAYQNGQLAILISAVDKDVSFLLKIGADGRITGKRTFAGEGGPGIYLHYHVNGIAIVFPHEVLLLDDNLKTVAQWMTPNLLVAAVRQGNGLWIVEGEPLAGPLDYHAGVLRMLTIDPNAIKEAFDSPLPNLMPLMPASILAWPDEVLALIPDTPEWHHCKFRPGMAETACKDVIWEYASPGIPMSLRTVVSRTGESGYLIAAGSHCDVLSRSYDRSHGASVRQATFQSERHVRVSDLLIEEYEGTVFALIAGSRVSPGADGYRTTLFPVRFVESSAEIDDGRPAACLAWGNTDFFYAATASDVATCIEVGADPNAMSGCNGQEGIPPLASALFNSTPEVVDVLLRAGADPDFRYGDGTTLLHEIPWPRHPEALAPLLRAMKDVNARDKSGKTALHHAARRLPPDVVGMLLDGGVDPTLRDNAGKLAWDYARDNLELEGSDALTRLTPKDGWRRD